MRRLILCALAVLVASAALIVADASTAPTQANAACPRVGEDGICLSDEIHPPTPIDPPGQTDAAIENTAAGGQGVCRDHGKAIPCTRHGFSWMSSPFGGCYGAVLDTAAAGDPAWAGHDPSEGSIAYCPLDGVSQDTFFVPNEAAPQVVDAAAVAQRMLARAPFEVADVQMAPPYGSRTYIRIENWFWVSEGQWHNVSLTEDVGPASVTLSAEPSRLVIDPGNNPAAPISCPDAGRPWREGMSNAARTTCSYAYESIKNPSGDIHNVGGRIYYEVSWSCAGLCSAPAGDLGEYPAPEGEEHPVEVRQRQTVVTQ